MLPAEAICREFFMVTLDLKDERIRATVRTIGEGERARARLTVDYPPEEGYSRRVRAALAEFLREPAPNKLAER
jgi:hypothetical protein